MQGRCAVKSTYEDRPKLPSEQIFSMRQIVTLFIINSNLTRQELKNRESFLWIHGNSLIFVTFLSFLKSFRKFIISKILDLQTLEPTNSLHLKIFWMIVLYVYCQKLKNWHFFFIFVFEFLTFNILIISIYYISHRCVSIKSKYSEVLVLVEGNYWFHDD